MALYNVFYKASNNQFNYETGNVTFNADTQAKAVAKAKRYTKQRGYKSFELRRAVKLKD